MRKLLIVPFVLLAAYMAWPLVAAWQLRTAVKSRDATAIEAKVDWKTLRANLKQTIRGNLKEKGANPEDGLVKRGLINVLAPVATDVIIEMGVTPQTLARVLAGRSMIDDLGLTKKKKEAPPPTTSEEDEEAANDPLAPRRLRWAFFETPLRFRIETVDRHLPGKRIVAILALQSMTWRLVDVYYITPT